MDLKLKDINIFIKKYYSLFNIYDINIIINNNVINIVFLSESNSDFWIHINDKFKFDNRFNNIENKNIKEFSIKLLELLNKKVKIPLSIKCGKIINNLWDKSIFILTLDCEIWNISKNQFDLLNKADKVYTDDINKLTELLIKLDINNIIINKFSDVKNNHWDLILINYGDYLEWDKTINTCLSENYTKYEKVFLLSSSTNFINKYSLSHTNYWNLLFLWAYNSNEKKSIQDKVDYFVSTTRSIHSHFSIWEMISLSWLSIEFKNYADLNEFIIDAKSKEIDNKFLFEIIFETSDWYYNIVDYISQLEYNHFMNKVNNTFITVFIYPKIWDHFLWYSRFNSNKNPKKITYISSPLSNVWEFTDLSRKELTKAKYIFWESITWVKNFLKNLKITYSDREILDWEDIEWINSYINKYGIYDKSKIDLVKNVFPELINQLDSSEQIHFLSDWWAPCILDPGDNIKKYINLYYPEYSVIWIKWPNVISTVLLWCVFEYKYIYWAPLIYSIYPAVDYLKTCWIFNKENFSETLWIFYSFWKNINKDISILTDLFWENSNIQIIWDIWTDNEYNKVYKLQTITEENTTYINKEIENIVYLLKIES